MLMEGMVAIVSLCCVMMFAAGSAELSGSPNQIYAHGIGQIPRVRCTSPQGIGMSFALMAFATFVYDTLDVCTRLGRFIIQELTGLRNWFGRILGTGLTAGVPVYFLLAAPNVGVHPETGLPVSARARLADFLEPVRCQQPALGRADAAGRHRLALADLQSTLGLARHRPADGLDVRHEHLGPVPDDAAQVPRSRRRLVIPPTPSPGSASS